MQQNVYAKHAMKDMSNPGNILKPNERGLILPSPLKLVSTPLYARSDPFAERSHIRLSQNPNLDRDSLIFGLTYFDHIVWPMTGMPFIGVLQSGTDLEATLQREGLLSAPIYYFDGYVESIESRNGAVLHTGEHSRQISRHNHACLKNLSEVNPGRWTMSFADPFVENMQLDLEAPGSIISHLYSTLPFVSSIEDIDSFLLWREKRATERRRLGYAVDHLAAELSENSDSAEKIKRTIDELKTAAEDLIRVTAERDSAFRLGSVRLRHDFEWKGTIRDGYVWGSGIREVFEAFTGIDLGGYAYLAGAYLSKIKIERQKGRLLLANTTIPSSCILSLQYTTSSG